MKSSMNGFQSSPADCPAGSVCSIEGLPPLPKGLSGILNSSGGSWRDIEKVYSKRTRIQADISKSRVSDCLGRSKPASLDAALAVLRKDMVRDNAWMCQCDLHWMSAQVTAIYGSRTNVRDLFKVLFKICAKFFWKCQWNV